MWIGSAIEYILKGAGHAGTGAAAPHTTNPPSFRKLTKPFRNVKCRLGVAPLTPTPRRPGSIVPTESLSFPEVVARIFFVRPPRCAAAPPGRSSPTHAPRVPRHDRPRPRRRPARPPASVH